MTLIVKTLKIDEDFDEKREIWFSPGSSDIPRGKLTKKNQNLKKKFFKFFLPPVTRKPTPIGVNISASELKFKKRYGGATYNQLMFKMIPNMATLCHRCGL